MGLAKSLIGSCKSMKLRKRLLLRGKSLFWLSVLIIILFGVSNLMFPRLRTYEEVKKFFAGGGQCYIGGDVWPEITCDEHPLRRSAVEHALNVPGAYLAILFLTPLFTADKFQVLRVQLLKGDPPFGRQRVSFREASAAAIVLMLWGLGVFSIACYVWKGVLKLGFLKENM